MYEAAFVFLGWLLSIVGTLIIDKVRKKIRSKEIRRSVLAELDELKRLLVWLMFTIREKKAYLNKDFIQWALNILNTYHGPLQENSDLNKLENLLSLNDDEFRQHLIGKNINEGTEPGWKTISLPAIDAHMPDIQAFPEEDIRVIFEIRRQVDLANQEIEYFRNFFQQTFNPSLDPDNRQAIEKNLSLTPLSLNRMSKVIIDLIQQLLQKYQEK